MNEPPENEKPAEHSSAKRGLNNTNNQQQEGAAPAQSQADEKSNKWGAPSQSHQFSFCLPPQSINAILLEKLGDIENQIRAFGAIGDDVVCLELLRERTRLQKILRGGASL